MRAAKTSRSGARVRGLTDAMPLTRLMATCLRKKLADVRKNSDLWWLRPDGETSRNGHSFVEFACHHHHRHQVLFSSGALVCIVTFRG